MESEIFQSELFERVLIKPATSGATELFIVSGYSSPSMVTRHFEILKSQNINNVTIDLTVGMSSKDGISLSALAGFQNLGRQLSGSVAKCKFVTGTPTHSKVYVWCNEDGPVQAFTGSANYTQTGFGISAANTQLETCVEVDPFSAFDFVVDCSSETISCNDPDLRDFLNIYDDPEFEVVSEQRIITTNAEFVVDADSVFLPLVQMTKNPGQVHNQGAGLNWGHRGSRSRDEAYIPIPSAVRKIDFFPGKDTHFQIVTDDGDSFTAAVVQGGDKALVSTDNNSLLGKYFRRKLQLPPGAFIETKHLNNFGSNCVKISRISEDSYFLSYVPGIKFVPKVK